MMAANLDPDEAMDGLFREEDDDQEQMAQTQTLTQEEGEQRAAANLDVTGAEDKKKRIIKNPQPKLNPERLMGPRGIHTLEDIFKDWQPRGRGREFDDLDIVMKKMEHWAHRLYPKLPFDDTLDIIANRLGKKKTVTTYVKKIRMGMVNPVRSEENTEDIEDQNDLQQDVARYDGGDEEERDLFEELAGSAAAVTATASQPLISSQPPRTSQPSLTEEQMERMRRNRELAARKKREREEAERSRREVEDRLASAEITNISADNTSISADNTNISADNTSISADNTNISADNTSISADSVSTTGANLPVDQSAPSALEWDKADEEDKVLDLDEMMHQMEQ